MNLFKISSKENL